MANDENGKSEESPPTERNSQEGNPGHESMEVQSAPTVPVPSEKLPKFEVQEMLSGKLFTIAAPSAEVDPAQSAVASTSSDVTKEMQEFKVIFNKQVYNIIFPWDDTVGSLKQHIQTLTGVPTSMQKVMFKGLAKDERTLRDLGVTKGAKVMVVGSTLTDVLAVNSLTKEDLKEEKAVASSKEPLCKQKMHKKVLDKGVPEDAMPGIKNSKDSLPVFPLSGMLNKAGGKLRLTFKLEMDQIWIGTKERTDKIPMSSIKHIVNEPIEGHEEYHILGIQLGPTEASRYWIYWLPAQYIDAIKDAVLGKWQYF